MSAGAARFPIRVKPGARRDAVGGSWDGPLGEALIVAVAAPAVGGKANDAVRKALAKELGVRYRQVVIARGERSRDKLVEVAAAPADLAERLARLRAA
jgi:uncharacterized protein